MQKRLSTLSGLLVAILLPFQPVLAAYNSMLAPTNFTPATYLQPKYDPFDDNYYHPPQLNDDTADVPPTPAFTVYNQNGLADGLSGTPKTEFVFDASASSDPETSSSSLETRWDFENDGKFDSYFSVVKSIRHTFKNPGVYTVKVEVLDRGGNISSAFRKITIVNNTPPFAYFTFTPTTGTEQSIFTFDTSRSRSDQYLASYLQYRFDWDGDLKWDTKFQQKTIWNHRFNDTGNHHVIMEAKDPSGQKAQAAADITTNANTPPVASFTIKPYVNGVNTTYSFDASSSADQETAHNRLLYRWDFNYSGPDDIVYDSLPSYADKFSGNYKIPGHKVIRLEVTDEDGATAYAYGEVDVAWTNAIMSNVLGGLGGGFQQ